MSAQIEANLNIPARKSIKGNPVQAIFQQKQQEIRINAQLDQAKLKLEAAKLMLETHKDEEIPDAGILIEKMKVLLNAEEI